MSGNAALLVGGKLITVDSVVLFEERYVREIARLKADASKQMGGVSTGLGSMGSLGWVAGATIAIGALEGILSKASRAAAVQSLQRAAELLSEMQKSALLCEMSGVLNVSAPDPLLWRFPVRRPAPFDLSALNYYERSKLLTEHGKKKSDIVNNTVTVSQDMHLVSDGGEFLKFKTSIGLINVRWSSVEAYQFPIET